MVLGGLVTLPRYLERQVLLSDNGLVARDQSGLMKLPFPSAAHG